MRRRWTMRKRINRAPLETYDDGNYTKLRAGWLAVEVRGKQDAQGAREAQGRIPQGPAADDLLSRRAECHRGSPHAHDQRRGLHAALRDVDPGGGADSRQGRVDR